MSQWMMDVSEENFEQEVVERSHTTPVVVDFWAPWCGPCRVIGPLLERLVDEAQGKFLLVKVNVDENPGLAQAFQVSSIPAVKAIRGGELQSEFIGAQSEAAIRQFVEALLPSDADALALKGQALQTDGKTQGAETLYRAALSKDPTQPAALVGLAHILVDRNEENDALTLLGRVALDVKESEAAQQLSSRIRLKQGGAQAGDEGPHRERLAADPDDLDARFELARVLTGAARHEEALAEYLEIVKRDKTFRDEGARTAMLEIFDVIGARSTLADHYRSELAKVLFS